jgi:hypothetical protein|tara:strand:- start:2695 stop:3021 length:327 start_codon:yes stop_codon:yes gene_type:complete
MGTVLAEHSDLTLRDWPRWTEACCTLGRAKKDAKERLPRRLSQKARAQEMSQASRQCIHEFKTLFHRWEQESDLEQVDILDCLKDALDEYYKEDVVEFDSEIDLEDEQ